MITIDFEKKGKFGLSEFIYISIKEQILSGKLNANYKLPSKRTFAEHLGVSIITIQNAYNQLICEGYIYSLEKKGYFVTDISLEPSIKQNHKKNVINHEETKKENAELYKKDEIIIDFTTNSTSAQKFPFNLWAHILRQVLNSSDEKLLQRIDAKGIFELRKAISSYLLEFRNMDVSPEQIIIASGTETLYTILSQLLDEQTIFAVENPGYHKVEKIFRINHKNCYPIQIDEQGIIIQELEKSKAEVVHVCPTHHFPTGIIMPVKRRLELLTWAENSKNHYIIEDDYDSEFRFNGKPLQTLFSYDKNNKVIYINTFSKTLTPSLRISYMILPQQLLDSFNKKLGFYSCTVSAFEQFALANFINQGFFGKHIIRMKNYYRSLRNALIQSLQNSKIAPKIQIKEEDSGLHFLLQIDSIKTKDELQKDLLSQGIKISLLSDFYYPDSTKSEIQQEKIFLINYSGIKKEQIPIFIKKLESVL